MEGMVRLCDFDHIDPNLAVATCSRCNKDGCRSHVTSLDVGINWGFSHADHQPTGLFLCHGCFQEMEFEVVTRTKEPVPV